MKAPPRSVARAVTFALPIAIAALVVPAAAHARDYCFNSSSVTPAVLIVAKDFKVPRRGKCRPIVGWDAGYFVFADARPASGTACLNTAGDTLHVGVTIHATFSAYGTEEQLQVHMRLPYPALSGGKVYLRQNLPAMISERDDGSAGDCGYAVTIP